MDTDLPNTQPDSVGQSQQHARSGLVGQGLEEKVPIEVKEARVCNVHEWKRLKEDALKQMPAMPETCNNSDICTQPTAKYLLTDKLKFDTDPPFPWFCYHKFDPVSLILIFFLLSLERES